MLLTGSPIQDTYESLLTLNNAGGLNGTLLQVSDGNGVSSALLLSESVVKVNGDLVLKAGQSIDTDVAGSLTIGGLVATSVNLGTFTGNTITTIGGLIVNIGTASSTVNILGTLLYENVTNLAVADKLFTINKGGAAGSATGAGMEIEENAVITGYIKTTGGRDGFLFKAPANTADSSFIFTSSSARTFTFPNVSGNVITSGDTGSVTNAMLAGSIAYNKMVALTAGLVPYTDASGFQAVSANLAWTNASSILGVIGTQTITAITPTANAVVNGLQLINPTAASASNQQYSPYILRRSNGWKTDSTAASQTVDFRDQVVPVQGAATPVGYWIMESSIAGAAFANSMVCRINTAGGFDFGINTLTPANLPATGNAITIQSAMGAGMLGLHGTTGGNIYFKTTSITQFAIISDSSAMSIYTNPTQSGTSLVAKVLLTNAGKVGIGIAPTAFLHLLAGTTTANTAPIKLTIGSANTTGESGAMEYSTIASIPQLTFVRSGTTRETILSTSSVNSVTPTLPNRTVTIIGPDGATYYLSAKTTND